MHTSAFQPCREVSEKWIQVTRCFPVSNLIFPPPSFLVRTLGVVTLVLGAVALSGWFIGSTRLTSVHPDYIPMAPNTALCFTLLGLLLFLLPGRRR